MGRIDEALRRARAPIERIEDKRPRADVFVSVWESDSQPERAMPRTPEIRRSPSVEIAPAPTVARPFTASPTFESVDEDWREKLALTTTHDVVIHQFRRLAAVLVQAQRSRRFKTVMVTSAVPGDGKTMTSLNVALVLSESYRRRVVLIEADFRRPRIASVVRLPIGDGLSDVMKSGEDRKVWRVQLTPNLTVVPAGTPDPDPLSGLTSTRMHEFLLSAAEEFDWVILDTPPTSVAADASLLAPFTDATILVVRAGHTPNAAVQQAVDVLGRERIAGVVLNAADDRSVVDNDYYYSSMAPAEPVSNRVEA